MPLLAMAVGLIPACSKKDDNNENEEEKTPTASFTVSNDSVFVNDTVYFTNTSTNAASYIYGILKMDKHPRPRLLHRATVITIPAIT